MEGQGKRLLLAVALALGVMLVWNMIFPSQPEDPPKPTAGAPGAPGAGQLVTPTSQVGVAALPAEPGQAELVRGPEQKIVLAFPGRFTATFSNHGGALVSWRLADPRFEKDPSRGELLPGRPGTGAFFVDFWKSDYALPKNAEWVGTQLSPNEVKYTLTTPRFAITKTFTVVPEAYFVRMRVDYQVKVPQGMVARQALAITSYAYQDPKLDSEGGQQIAARVFVSSTDRGDGETFHTTMPSLFKHARYEPSIQWTGFEHPYLLAGYAPRRAEGEAVEKHSFALADDSNRSAPSGVMQTDIVFGAATFRTGDPAVPREIVAYLGPKHYDDLERADEVAGFPTGFVDTVDLGWFAFIGRPLLWLMLKFFAVVQNWGVAIILLTVLVKLLTLYWTTKSMRSMKGMAALAPQLKAVQEKYKDDRQRIQAETMALYKQHNVNPIAGCLPILLQMPVWIALYRMLSSAGELYAQPFLPGWIDDLTSTDPYYILPIVLLVTMFLQARLTPQAVDSRQQKFLQYGMPLMFGVMAFFFPAGLTLYIFTNTVLSALHSIYMNKYDKKSIELTAKMKKNQEAAQETAKAPAPAAGAGAKKNGKPAAAKPKPVIDVTAVETSNDADEGDEAGDQPASGSTAPGPARQRPRRKKRRR